MRRARRRPPEAPSQARGASPAPPRPGAQAPSKGTQGGAVAAPQGTRRGARVPGGRAQASAALATPSHQATPVGMAASQKS